MFRDVKSHLRAGGALLINTLTDSSVTSPGVMRIMASLHAVFADVMVFESSHSGLHNVFLVAYSGPHRSFRTAEGDPQATALTDVTAQADAPPGARSMPGTDDRSDIDYAYAATAEALRRTAIASSYFWTQPQCAHALASTTRPPHIAATQNRLTASFAAAARGPFT